mmetsp:Transcript_6071/g.14825  ORF Transcript_6071/g.14825 Transcript_6071/m.14825 type:complete len:151 (-) Transcript_6071:4083-4535(-)
MIFAIIVFLSPLSSNREKRGGMSGEFGLTLFLFCSSLVGFGTTCFLCFVFSGGKKNRSFTMSNHSVPFQMVKRMGRRYSVRYGLCGWKEDGRERTVGSLHVGLPGTGSRMDKGISKLKNARMSVVEGQSEELWTLKGGEFREEKEKGYQQ